MRVEGSARVSVMREGADLRYGVLDAGVLLLLDLDLRPILELPLDDVGLVAHALGVFRGGDGRPELGEVLTRC